MLPKFVRYSGVSVVAVVVTQLTLLLCHRSLGWPGVTSNIVATAVGAIPAYLLNRRWVWGLTGSHSVRREIVPFWTYTFVGLLFSTALVAAADKVWDSALALSLANLTAWGLLWIGKFLVFDRLLFGRRMETALARS